MMRVSHAGAQDQRLHPVRHLGQVTWDVLDALALQAVAVGLYPQKAVVCHQKHRAAGLAALLELPLQQQRTEQHVVIVLGVRLVHYKLLRSLPAEHRSALRQQAAGLPARCLA